MAKTTWGSDWTVGVRVWVEREGHAVLGEGRAELMAAIDREQSITRAAKAIGMSYRRAWTIIQEVNASAGETFVEAAVGGAKGGGARLTPRGRLAVEVFEQVRQTLVEAAGSALRQAAAPRGTAGDCVHLAAAISMQEAVGQILAEFALREPAVRVRAIFGASNELADHLLAGSPGDVFVSAEPGELDRLEAARLLAPASRQAIARNTLAIVGRQSSARLSQPKLRDLLDKRFRRVAVAEPACPLGRCSQALLLTLGLYDDLRPKLLQVDNSRAVLAAVVSGAADAGIAFSSDAARAGNWRVLSRVPAAKGAATYEAAIVGRAKPRADVRSLFDFLSSTTAQRAVRRCGLRPAKVGA